MARRVALALRCAPPPPHAQDGTPRSPKRPPRPRARCAWQPGLVPCARGHPCLVQTCRGGVLSSRASLGSRAWPPPPPTAASSAPGAAARGPPQRTYAWRRVDESPPPAPLREPRRPALALPRPSTGARRGVELGARALPSSPRPPTRLTDGHPKRFQAPNEKGTHPPPVCAGATPRRGRPVEPRAAPARRLWWLRARSRPPPCAAPCSALVAGTRDAAIAWARAPTSAAGRPRWCGARLPLARSVAPRLATATGWGRCPPRPPRSRGGVRPCGPPLAGPPAVASCEAADPAAPPARPQPRALYAGCWAGDRPPQRAGTPNVTAPRTGCRAT